MKFRQIKALRLDLGLTLDELSAATGLTRWKLSLAEKGIREFESNELKAVLRVIAPHVPVPKTSKSGSKKTEQV
jgi:hypothetical protein